MVNSKLLKAGSVIEARFNDSANRCGIVISVERDRKPVEGKPFTLRAMFFMEEFGTHREISIESSQVVFVAPVQPDFAAIINTAKEALMRWTCTIDGEESVALDYASMTTPEDGFNLSDEEAAKLKSMELNSEFSAGEGEALIKRVA